MSDRLANAQLDLACQVGSREAIIEAIEDGADINHSDSSPLILAIMAGDRVTVSTLIELGADVSLFETNASERESLIDELMKGTQSSQPISDEDPVDAKLVRAFDKLIRTKGLGEPFAKKRGADYPAFHDSLKWLAAEDCQLIVEDFLQRLEPSRQAEGDIGVDRYLNEHSAAIKELSGNYAAATDLPAELLKEYLKERKKLLQ